MEELAGLNGFQLDGDIGITFVTPGGRGRTVLKSEGQWRGAALYPKIVYYSFIYN